MTADVNGDTSPGLANINWLAVAPIARAASVVMVFSVILHIIGCNGSAFAQTLPGPADAARMVKQFDMPAEPILTLPVHDLFPVHELSCLDACGEYDSPGNSVVDFTLFEEDIGEEPTNQAVSEKDITPPRIEIHTIMLVLSAKTYYRVTGVTSDEKGCPMLRIDGDAISAAPSTTREKVDGACEFGFRHDVASVRGNGIDFNLRAIDIAGNERSMSVIVSTDSTGIITGALTMSGDPVEIVRLGLPTDRYEEDTYQRSPFITEGFWEQLLDYESDGTQEAGSETRKVLEKNTP